MTPLNEQWKWEDVRFQINRHVNSYDVQLSFNQRPERELLAPGTLLYRLDFAVTFGIFMKTWWIKDPVFRRIFDRASPTPSSLRQEWQNTLALSKPGKGKEGKFGGRTGEASMRTQVLVIQIVQPAYAWVGSASPLFNKSGGEEQVYLPNLARGTGPDRSEYARLFRTYALPAI